MLLNPVTLPVPRRPQIPQVHFFETSCAKKEGVDAALTKAPPVTSRCWASWFHSIYPGGCGKISFFFFSWNDDVFGGSQWFFFRYFLHFVWVIVGNEIS